MEEFLSGATMLGSLCIALFFLRFYRDSGDRLFAVFALAFTVFALNRLLLMALDDENERRVWVYVVRLLMFVLILGAIVDKNRSTPPAES